MSKPKISISNIPAVVRVSDDYVAGSLEDSLDTLESVFGKTNLYVEAIEELPINKLGYNLRGKNYEEYKFVFIHKGKKINVSEAKSLLKKAKLISPKRKVARGGY